MHGPAGQRLEQRDAHSVTVGHVRGLVRVRVRIRVRIRVRVRARVSG